MLFKKYSTKNYDESDNQTKKSKDVYSVYSVYSFFEYSVTSIDLWLFFLLTPTEDMIRLNTLSFLKTANLGFLDPTLAALFLALFLFRIAAPYNKYKHTYTCLYSYFEGQNNLF